MFKNISIKNFQSHKKTSINFSEGVNAITGQSDSGKSAIIRALIWLITNRPTGEYYKRWGTKSKENVSVELSTDKNLVCLSRSFGKNEYKVDETTFSAIKTDVPEEVSDALNISEYNIQTQHQRYFLIQDSPGEIARKLNELVGLDVIDSSFKYLNGKIREVTANISRLKVERNDLEIKLEEFNNLYEVQKLITSIEKKHSKTEEIEASLSLIKKIVVSLDEIEKDKGRLEKIVSLETSINKLRSTIGSYIAVKSKVVDLKDRINKLKTLREDSELDKVWIEIVPLYNKLKQSVELYLKIKDKKTKLENCLTRLNKVLSNKKECLASKKKSILRYTKIMMQKGICPTCGSKVEEKKLKEIMENI